jgi:DNA-directed RNA polymerase specialized sigma subunit
MITDAKLILKICELYRQKQNIKTISETLGVSEFNVQQVISDWFE